MNGRIISKQQPYYLGLDIGVRSIGWAVIDVADGRPRSIRRFGVRCFEAGVDGNIAAGQDASRAATRREKRLPRRQAERRARRRRKVFAILQRHGLLPAGPASSPKERSQLLAALDAKLRRKVIREDDHRAHQLLPYLLRSNGTRECLELHAVGRALFHLSQRRGYDSNRRDQSKSEAPQNTDSQRGPKNATITAAKQTTAGNGKPKPVARSKPPEDDLGVVKQGIEQLGKRKGTRTLGEYFAESDPFEKRIRQQWTARDWFKEEFTKIWNTQQPHHPEMTDELRKELFRAIFFQRPLKSQKGLVGKCDLEPKHRRLALALSLAQEFRIQQGINHLRLSQPIDRPAELNDAERKVLFDALMERGDLTFAQVRKFPEFRGIKFTAETDEGEKRIVGNRTIAKLLPIFGERWYTFSPETRDQIVRDVLYYQKRHALIRRAEDTWKLNREDAERLSEVSLEPGYSRHSRPALTKLLEHMRDGRSYSEAKAQAYGISADGVPLDVLPSVKQAFGDLRSPAVTRALTELRKIVNALIHEYGKPELIRIELARDLKRSRKDRKRMSKEIEKQTKRRDDAKRRLLENAGIDHPSRHLVEKVLLADECGWHCPITGEGFQWRDLVGAEACVDVAHIFPRRYLDDSFLNKTLCFAEANRNVWKDRLPTAAFGSSDEWNRILDRVRAFNSPSPMIARLKLERFQAVEVPEDFAQRQLNDTRYNAVLATEYLALLYGGRWDASGSLRVQASAGGLTAHLRNEWQLNGILGDGGEKTRLDHRHHAVDAVVVALTGPETQQQLQRAAERASQLGQRRMFASVDAPWTCFVDSIREAIGEVVVSHRVNRKLAGPLHAESLYSREISVGNGKTRRHIRKALDKLKETELEGDAIVDPVVRKLVQEKWFELRSAHPTKKPADLFSDASTHPCMLARNGRRIPIHKVRIATSVKAEEIGSGARRRYVTPDSNHHTIIVAHLDRNGVERSWSDEPLSRLAAHRRAAAGQPVVQPDLGEACRFKFTLTPGDAVLLDDAKVYIVQSISKGDMELKLHCDARKATDLRGQKGGRFRASAEKLRKRKAHKVTVTPLGDVIPCND